MNWNFTKEAYALIEVENLVKRYGNHVAVDHLSFRIDPGKIYGFLGPNGAGKSTTMNIMTGYIAPSEGTVKVNGYDIQKNPEEAKKSIGYLPEIPPLYLDMTVLEYLNFAAALKKIDKKEREDQLQNIMQMTMIDDIPQRLIKNLSKGYKQRVGLAQAILGYPEVIILDEPTVGLDPKQMIEIRELIKKLSKEHTILLSSHILSEVQAVCDEIMILSHGKLVAQDTAEGLTGRMNGTSSLELKVKGTRTQLEKVLPFIAGVTDYSVKKADEAECVKLILTIDQKEDIREELFYAFAENKLPIYAMQKSEQSLEDIFLALTDGRYLTSLENEKAKRKNRKKAARLAEQAMTEDEDEQLRIVSMHEENDDEINDSEMDEYADTGASDEKEADAEGGIEDESDL